MLTVPLPCDLTAERSGSGWRVRCDGCGYEQWLVTDGPVPVERLARWLQRLDREHAKAHKKGKP